MQIKLIQEKIYKNGDARYTFEFDNEVKEIVKQKYNKKRYTQKLGRLFLLEGIHKYLIKVLDEGLEKGKRLNGISK